jgi:surface antigen
MPKLRSFARRTFLPWALAVPALLAALPAAAFAQARFVGDVTYPDHSVVSAGAAFTKTWRFQNVGSATWNGYRLYFKWGDSMSQPSYVSVASTPPGGYVNISVNLRAPSSPTYAAKYQRYELRDSSNRVQSVATCVVTINPHSGPNLASRSYALGGVNPYVNSGYGGQCTAFAWGRANEKQGVTNLPTGNANTWYGSWRGSKGSTPKAGAIACWTNNNVGHVAYVESVSGQNVVINEANYNSYQSDAAIANPTWGGGYDGATKTLTTSQMTSRFGPGTLQGYIYP